MNRSWRSKCLTQNPPLVCPHLTEHLANLHSRIHTGLYVARCALHIRQTVAFISSKYRENEPFLAVKMPVWELTAGVTTSDETFCKSAFQSSIRGSMLHDVHCEYHKPLLIYPQNILKMYPFWLSKWLRQNLPPGVHIPNRTPFKILFECCWRVLRHTPYGLKIKQTIANTFSTFREKWPCLEVKLAVSKHTAWCAHTK